MLSVREHPDKGIYSNGERRDSGVGGGTYGSLSMSCEDELLVLALIGLRMLFTHRILGPGRLGRDEG